MYFMFVGSFRDCFSSCITQPFALSLSSKKFEVKSQVNLPGTKCFAFFRAVHLDKTELQPSGVLVNQVRPEGLTG